jgi:hypothetical protein
MTRKLAEEELAIMIAERELKAKRLALSEAQKAAGNGDDEEDDEEGRESTPEEPQVRH